MASLDELKNRADTLALQERGQALRADITQPPGVLAPTPTLRQEAERIFGFDPNIKRASLLPFGRNPKGELVPAWPRSIVEMAEGALLPARAMRGDPYTYQDVARFAMDYNPMASASRGVQAAYKPKPTPRQFRRGVMRDPDMAKEAIKTRALGLFDEAQNLGVQATARSTDDFITKMRATVMDEFGDSQVLYGKSFNLIDEWVEKLKNARTLRDLELRRREAKTLASNFSDPENQAIGMLMREEIDDYLSKLTPMDVDAGDPEKAVSLLKEYRRLYQRQAKADTIDEVIGRAEIAGAGVEAGLRNEFRSLLKNKRRRAGFTKQEQDMMRRIVTGDTMQNFLRFLQHFGPPSDQRRGWLGTGLSAMAGGVAGGEMAGPYGVAAGVMAPMAVGNIASRLASGRQQATTDLLRAMALTGQGGVQSLAQRMAAPVARQGMRFVGSGAQGPQENVY